MVDSTRNLASKVDKEPKVIPRDYIDTFTAFCFGNALALMKLR